MGSNGSKMKAEELKTVLNNIITEIKCAVEGDLEGIEVEEEWSNIPFVREHLEFILEQTEGLSSSLRDKVPGDDEENARQE